jgi:hypothetical protein
VDICPTIPAANTTGEGEVELPENTQAAKVPFKTPVRAELEEKPGRLLV